MIIITITVISSVPFAFVDPEALSFTSSNPPSLHLVVTQFYVELVKTFPYVSKYIFTAYYL